MRHLSSMPSLWQVRCPLTVMEDPSLKDSPSPAFCVSSPWVTLYEWTCKHTQPSLYTFLPFFASNDAPGLIFGFFV
uniref:Ovule protein n=1 Tax=Caenorhabditis tropicalis TaxID=1561998 RepID=A0A1I7UPG1_9PELO